jgi:putative peptidoglycan lipid II flippase
MPDDKETKLNTKAAGIVGLAVMCSRVLGLIREQIFAWLFGGGKEMDAFTVAFRTPNMLRDLFAEGALSTAFITTFSKKIVNEGEDSAWRLASKVATLVIIALSLIVLIGILIAPWLVKIMAPGFAAVPGKAELTVLLARVMYPFILMVSLGALTMGMLNARNVFGVPAMASSFFNIGSIVGGVAVGWWIDPHFGPRALVGLACGTLIGGALQLGVQMPALRRVGFHFRPDFAWRDEGVRTILRQMGPAVIAASSVQLNVFINTWFASWLEDGTAYRLNIAFRLMQLPLGIFGVALGTVTLPALSRAAAQGRSEEFRTLLAKGLRLALLLTGPATIGLILLARPIISLLYEHGKFSAHATDQAAIALGGYAIGLCAYSCLKILAPAFYAIDRRRTPMCVSFGAVFLNVALNYLFAFKLHWGIRGLALATGCVATANFLILYFLMHRATGRLDTRQMLATLVKIALAGAVLAAVCLAAQHWVLAGWADFSLALRIVSLLGVIAVAGLAFFGTAFALRIEELDDLAALVRRKLARRR